MNEEPEKTEAVTPLAAELKPMRMADLSPEYAEIMVLANVLYKSGYFKDLRDQAQAVTKILFGRELGFSPTISLGGLHVIEGKPALSSNLMGTLIKRSGKYDYRIKTWTDTECILTFRQKTNNAWEDVGESPFTLDDAKRAGVVKPGGSWAKYPRAMLFARALSQGLRAYCPDVSAAPIYNPEEMGAEVSEEGDVITLPKSAQPTERTTEDIEVKRPLPKTESVEQKKENQVEAKPVERKSDNQPTVWHAEMPAPISVAESPAMASGPTGNGQYIRAGEQTNFARCFKEALKPALRVHADEIRHDWLKKQGIVDSDGQPSAKAILKVNFYNVRNASESYARELTQWP